MNSEPMNWKLQLFFKAPQSNLRYLNQEMPTLKRLCLLFLLLLTTSAMTHSEEAEPELIHLYQYKPIYFLMGNPYTKIELSFKAEVIRDVPLYFGYTQLMMWQIFVNSPYFYDLNYNPEIFYRFFVQHDQDKWFDLSAGHESNGKGGLEERSWDTLYLRYHTRTSIGEKSRLFWDLLARAPVYQNPNDPDLFQFRGVWELNVTLANFLGPFFEVNDLSLRLYPGGHYYTNPVFGGQELTLRLKSTERRFLPLLVAQVFHGYGEYLLDYNVNHWGLRAGIGF